MPIQNAVNDVYDYLVAQAFVQGVTGWDITKRRMMDQPAKDQLVVVLEDGGPLSEQHAAAGIGDSALSSVGVQIAVRAGALDGNASAAKAQAIKDALHGLRSIPLTTNGVLYFSISAMTPEPIFAGYDDSERPTHTVSFRLLKAT